jgi:MFS family permease
MGKGSIEARQLWSLGILSALLSLVFSGLEVLYTLFALNEIKISASEWSQIRAYRYILTALIVLVLGTYAGKWGQKKIASMTVACAVINLLAFTLQPTKLFLFITLPLHAALLSMVTMSMNVMVQEVPSRLQAASNTVYRSTYTGLAVFGPLLVAVCIDKNRTWLFLFFVVCLLVCLFVFIMYPQREKDREETAESRSLGDLIKEWGFLLHNKRFIVFEIGVTIIYSSFLVNTIFGPIKLIQTLGISDRHFSYISTVVAVVTMGFTLVAGLLLGKILGHLVYWPLFISSFGNVLFGMQSNIGLSIGLFVAANALNTLTFASVSIWTSRIVDKTQVGLAFAFHKIFISLLGFVFSILLAGLEIRFGIDHCMIIMGAVGCLFSLLLKREMRVHQQPAGG